MRARGRFNVPWLYVGRHPLRSTLIWVLLAQGIVFWSTFRVLADTAAALMQEDLDRLGVFVRLSGGAQMAGVLLTLTSWMEHSTLSSAAQNRADLLVTLDRMGRSDGAALEQWSPVPILVARLGMAFTLASSVCMCVAWLAIDEKGRSWSHLPAHVHYGCVPLLITISQVCNFLRSRDVARRLLALLRKESCPSATRIRAYRHVWLLLYRQACERNVLPATCVTHTILLLAIFTINGYTAALAYLSAYSGQNSGQGTISVAISCAFAALISALSVLLINDAAHCLSQEIEAPFLRVLQSDTLACRLNVDVRCELELFRDTLMAKSPSVSVGGFFHLSRGTFTAMAASVITYLVVLVQLRTGVDSGIVSAQLTGIES